MNPKEFFNRENNHILIKDKQGKTSLLHGRSKINYSEFRNGFIENENNKVDRFRKYRQFINDSNFLTIEKESNFTNSSKILNDDYDLTFFQIGKGGGGNKQKNKNEYNTISHSEKKEDEKIKKRKLELIEKKKKESKLHTKTFFKELNSSIIKEKQLNRNFSERNLSNKTTKIHSFPILGKSFSEKIIENTLNLNYNNSSGETNKTNPKIKNSSNKTNNKTDLNKLWKINCLLTYVSKLPYD